jgi:hypothetical protein
MLRLDVHIHGLSNNKLKKKNINFIILFLLHLKMQHKF